MFPRSVFVLLFISLFLAAGPARPVEIIDLGTLGGASSHATDVNSSGQVVGYSDISGPFGAHAFLYSGGHMNDLGTINGTFSTAFGINNAGQVVGQSDFLDIVGYDEAFLYTPQKGMRPIPFLNVNNNQGMATAINNLGQIVGTEANGIGLPRAFLFTPGVGIIDLGSLDGGTSSAAGINDSGLVVGSSAGHAFLYSSHGGMVDLGTLGGDFSSAAAINSLNQIVGVSFVTGDTALDSFLYTPGVGMIDIGSLQANDINGVGTVVGFELGVGAVLYDNGVTTDLNSLLPANSGWRLDNATGINDSGQIVGYGEINGATHAFLLNTIPEPVSVALFATGMLFLGLLKKRLRRS